MSVRKIIRFRVRLQLSQSRCLSLLLAMSSRVFLFFPPRGQPLTPSFSNTPLCQTPGCHVRFPSGWCFSTLGPRAGFFTLDYKSINKSKRMVLFSRLSFVDIPLIFYCPADHVPDWQPRTLLSISMVEIARSVNNVKNTQTRINASGIE